MLKMEAWRKELYHYGIKGMRWGVRRYQKADGSLTAAGRARYTKQFLGDYRDSEGNLNDKGRAKNKQLREINEFIENRRKYQKATDEDLEKRYAPMKDAIEVGNETVRGGRRVLEIYDRISDMKSRSVDLSNMSDKELQQSINRMNLEQNYLRLMTASNKSMGRQLVEDIFTIGGGTLAVASSAVTIALGIQKLRNA